MFIEIDLIEVYFISNFSPLSKKYVLTIGTKCIKIAINILSSIFIYDSCPKINWTKIIKENNAKTFEDISKITSAGLACGNCRKAIEGILKEHLEEKKIEELNPVQKILKINSIIEKEMSPELRKDNGDIELVDIDGNNVYVKLKGQCSHCANAKLTLKNFVEMKLKELAWDEIRVFEA